MLHPRSSKDKGRVRRVSDSAATRDEAAVDTVDEEHARPSSDGTSDLGAVKRIAELEQALSTALEEQNKMGEELVKLRGHGEAYRETIDEHRRTIAATYQPRGSHPDSRLESIQSNLDDGDIMLQRSTNQPLEDLMQQNGNLRDRVTQLQDQLMTQDATYQSMLDQRILRTEAEWDALTARLHSSEKESQERLQQLMSLKSAFSSLTRNESQTTDGELSETFAQLYNRMREWSIKNYRRARLDFSNLPQRTAEALEGIYPAYRDIGLANRLALIQAIVSFVMTQIFQESFFVGLPANGPLAALRQVAVIIRETGIEYHAWRHATIRSLKGSDAERAIAEEKSLQVHQWTGGIVHHLTSVTSTTLPPESIRALESILFAAVEFQNTLLLQRARYRIESFQNQGDFRPSFDDRQMEPVNELDGHLDEDGDVVTDRNFEFCVFPCLEKFGDEHGEHVDVSNMLVKAKVCCSIG